METKSKHYGRVAKREKKSRIPSQLEFIRRHVGDTDVTWNKVLWSEETKIELFDHQTMCYDQRRTQVTVASQLQKLVRRCLFYTGTDTLVLAA